MTCNANIAALLLACLLAGCVSKTEMYPSDGGATPGATAVSVRYLKTLYTGYATPLSGEYELLGHVTANDRYGSLPHTLYVEDETGGIALKIGGEDLYAEFSVGRKVLVSCRGLVLGGYGGEVSLGAPSAEAAYQNGFIPREDLPLYLRAQDEQTTLYPAPARIEELTPVLIGSYVCFERLQFIDEELTLSWCDPDADTDRHLVNPRGDTLVVRTSRQALYGDQLLPRGSGYIEGILGYFNRTYQLRVLTHTRAVMEAERFTPVLP